MIVIPKTSEYGWVLTKSEEREFVPSKKVFWNRLDYYFRQKGGILERRTTGFEVYGVEISDEDKQFVAEEMEKCKMNLQEVPTDISRNESGREEPNLDDSW